MTSGLKRIFSFSIRFFLYFASYTGFSLLPNLALFTAGCFRFTHPVLRTVQSALIILAAVIIFYHDSYLPGWGQLTVSLHENQSPLAVILDSCLEMISKSLLILLIFIVITVFFISDLIHLYTLIVAVFIFIAAEHLSPYISEKTVHDYTLNNTDSAPQSMDLPPQIGEATNENAEKYYQTFLAAEGLRQVQMPYELPKNFESFDILMINICSLSTSDIEASGLTTHEVFSKFDFIFDNFNSVSSYSTPATLRLLLSNCGQRTETEIYSNVRPECQLIGSIERLGYQIHIIFDHNGIYGKYHQTLQELAGLPEKMYPPEKFSKRYISFDGTPIYADSAVFSAYLNLSDQQPGQIFAFMNLISLHDGNRLLGENHSMPYPPRLRTLLDDLNKLMDLLKKRNRNTLLIVIPEHGAAIKGDKMQISKLREIPTDSITKIPVMVKFFGLNSELKLRHIKEQHSYLSVAELIKRSIENNVFSENDATENPMDICTELPQQAFISESTNACFMNFKGRDLFKLKGEEWTEYKK